MNDLISFLDSQPPANLWPKPLLTSSGSGLVDRVACLVSDKVGAHRTMLTDVVAPASDSLELDLQFIVELLPAANGGSRASTASSETSGKALFYASGPW